MTPKQIGDQPAFAAPESDNYDQQMGMTYRQWLVGMAMQAVAAKWVDENQVYTASIATSSVSIADAVLAELAKEGK